MADFDDHLIHPMAGGPESDNLNSTLHAPYLTETVQLQPTIIFSELLISPRVDTVPVRTDRVQKELIRGFISQRF
jgi:hypothetical protein